jgi:hypothetical protein
MRNPNPLGFRLVAKEDLVVNKVSITLRHGATITLFG